MELTAVQPCNGHHWTSASSLGYSQDARMDDLSGQLLWTKPILSPHSHVHQAQPSQSHGFLLSGTKALTSVALRPKQAAAPSWTRLPYPKPGFHKTLTQEGHGLHTITHYLQALVLTHPGFHCLMTWSLTQRGSYLKTADIPLAWLQVFPVAA